MDVHRRNEQQWDEVTVQLNSAGDIGYPVRYVMQSETTDLYDKPNVEIDYDISADNDGSLVVEIMPLDDHSTVKVEKIFTDEIGVMEAKNCKQFVASSTAISSVKTVSDGETPLAETTDKNHANGVVTQGLREDVVSDLAHDNKPVIVNVEYEESGDILGNSSVIVHPQLSSERTYVPFPETNASDMIAVAVDISQCIKVEGSGEVLGHGASNLESSVEPLMTDKKETPPEDQQIVDDLPLSPRHRRKRRRTEVDPDYSVVSEDEEEDPESDCSGESDQDMPVETHHAIKRTYATRNNKLPLEEKHLDIDICVAEEKLYQELKRKNRIKKSPTRTRKMKKPKDRTYGFGYQLFCCYCYGVFLSYNDFMNHIENGDSKVTHAEKNIDKNRDTTSLDHADEKFFLKTLIDDKCQKIHMNFLCVFCGKVMENFESFVSHVDQQHAELFEVPKYFNSACCLSRLCHICGKMFNSHKQIVDHIAVHAQHFSCDYCHFSAPTNPSLRNHILSHHPESGMTQEKVKCKMCDAELVNVDGLRIHVRTVHLRKKKCTPRQCAECGKVLSSKCGLDKHINEVHTRAPKYHCDWENCDKAFKTLRHLKQHKRIHTGEKPFQCSLCDYTCSQKASLNWHFKSKHPGEPVTAAKPLPPKRVDVPKSDAKKYLESLRTVELRYTCDHCSIKCQTASNMAWHLKTRHSISVDVASLKPVAPSQITCQNVQKS